MTEYDRRPAPHPSMVNSLSYSTSIPGCRPQSIRDAARQFALPEALSPKVGYKFSTKPVHILSDFPLPHVSQSFSGKISLLGMAEKHNFIMDPSGDVILTLSNPDAPFAVWDRSGISDTDKQIPEDNPTPAPAPDVTFLLSSRHLSLASPVLKTMLSGPWSEGVKMDSDSLYHLTAGDWDSEALAMVMNVIHGRWSLVPTTVALEMLAKIAVIIDYYDIREPLQLILSLWMKDFKASSIPMSLGRELVLWILVSWVFKDQALFQQAIKVAILRSTHELDVPGDLPIPSAIISE